MRFQTEIDFEFSACSYHEESDFDFHTALSLMRENSLDPQEDYQVWAFRDLLLEIAKQIAQEWPEVESSIRQDVVDRLGYPNGVAPNPAQPEGTMLRTASQA